MCGFSGFISTATKNIYDYSSSLEAMGRVIAHRGPDASGYWFDESHGVGLGHVRLSILELSDAGAQPMHSANERFVISFNGEIYNHLAIRSQLEQQIGAVSWRGHSDTETLVECFSKWGIERTLKATVGMFAIALFDLQKNILTLARDRLGEKPLYWGWYNQSVVFASELKAIKEFANNNLAIDRSSLSLLLKYSYIPAPYSIYQEIEKLPAGHYVQIRKGQERNEISPVAFWSLNQTIENGIKNRFIGSDTEAIDLLEKTLLQAVTGQTLSDVALGAFLSGGVDSSTIVALMQTQSKLPVQTFAIGFDEPSYNEAIFAKEVANHLGTEHTELYITANDALNVVPKLPTIYCEPFADSSQIPTFLVTQLARKKVTVALSGDAGDELFGGYTPYQFAPRTWNAIRRLPLGVRQLMVKLLNGLPMPAKAFKLLRVLPSKDRQNFYHILMTHWQNSLQIVVGSKQNPTIFNTQNHWPQASSFEEWMMAIDANQYMTDDILVKVDRSAMANSLETRVPMLDHRVVELAWRFPLNFKIRDGVGKWILRQLLYRYVPKNLIERPKKGFSIPLAHWLRGPLRDWAESLISEDRLLTEGFLNAQIVRKTWNEHISRKRDHANRLWNVLMFQAWLENK